MGATQAGSQKAWYVVGTGGAERLSKERESRGKSSGLKCPHVTRSPLPNLITFLFERFLYSFNSKEGFGQKRGCSIPKASTCRNKPLAKTLMGKGREPWRDLPCAPGAVAGHQSPSPL